MNANSDDTWMKAATRGLRKPNAAIPTPMLSTATVPTKFCMMMRRHRRATRNGSTNFERSLPIKIASALSRATSVPDPIAIPTLAMALDYQFPAEQDTGVQRFLPELLVRLKGGSQRV
jgi:hypothetical protein